MVKHRKGVCEDYSLLFDAIVRELGFASYVIEGYTKNGDGRANRSLGHTWNAVKVNSRWKLYDPTWGAGYVENEKKFVKSYNQEWYDVDSEEMIKTHMPLDPIWQLSNSPMSYESFERNLSNIESEVKFDYEELIQKHGEKDKKQ